MTTKVLPQCEPEKVKVDGPGVEKTGVKASLPVEFTVDTRDAGDADLAIAITVGSSLGVDFHSLWQFCVNIRKSRTELKGSFKRG